MWKKTSIVLTVSLLVINCVRLGTGEQKEGVKKIIKGTSTSTVRLSLQQENEAKLLWLKTKDLQGKGRYEEVFEVCKKIL